MIVIAAIAYFFWAILGLIFWIPLLVRIVAAFCGGLVYNMVINNPENIQRSKVSLDLALSFYARGFENIQSALFEKKSYNNNNSTNPEFHLASFIGQILWTLIFWATVILPFMDIEISNLFHRD